MHLEDISPILRGGIPDESRWYESVLDSLDEEGRALLSVNGDNHRPGESDADLITRIVMAGDIKHGKIATTSVRAVKALGHTLEHDDSGGQAPNHFHIVFTGEPTMLAIRELIAVFSEPFSNPAKARNY